MFKSTIIALILVLLNVSSIIVDAQKELEKQTLDSILDKNRYDNRIIPIVTHPNGTSSPVVITVNMYIRQIEHICTKDMEWKPQITLRHQWTDPRLQFDDKNGRLKFLSLEDTDRIWKPDTFISNSKATEANSDLKPNTLIRIYPNGNVLFSIRLTTALTCPMDLRYYPFDSQICSIQLASYGYTTDSIAYLWKNDDPVQITKNLNLQDFTLTKFNTDYCTSRTNTGEYSCLKASLAFKRVANKYYCQWLIPAAVLTLVSFLSFWMKPNKSNRIKLLVVSLILLYLQTIYINSQSSATVSYSTSKDCWLSTCFIFVLAAFVEYVVIRFVDQWSKCKENTSTETHRLNGKSEDSEKGVEENKQKPCNLRKWQQSSLSSKIDMVFGILFPLAFIIYIIVFISTN